MCCLSTVKISRASPTSNPQVHGLTGYSDPRKVVEGSTWTPSNKYINGPKVCPLYLCNGFFCCGCIKVVGFFLFVVSDAIWLFHPFSCCYRALRPLSFSPSWTWYIRLLACLHAHNIVIIQVVVLVMYAQSPCTVHQCRCCWRHRQDCVRTTTWPQSIPPEPKPEPPDERSRPSR